MTHLIEHIDLKELRFSCLMSAIGSPDNWDFLFVCFLLFCFFFVSPFPKIISLENPVRGVGACLNAEKQQLWG